MAYSKEKGSSLLLQGFKVHCYFACNQRSAWPQILLLFAGWNFNPNYCNYQVILTSPFLTTSLPLLWSSFLHSLMWIDLQLSCFSTCKLHSDRTVWLSAFSVISSRGFCLKLYVGSVVTWETHYDTI